MNLLRQNILRKIDVLAQAQTDLSVRIQNEESKQENSRDDDLQNLSLKFDELRNQLSNFEKDLSLGDSERGDQLERRLTDLQAKIEKLELDLAEMKLVAKRCCRNETFIRELVIIIILFLFKLSSILKLTNISICWYSGMLKSERIQISDRSLLLGCKIVRISKASEIRMILLGFRTKIFI